MTETIPTKPPPPTLPEAPRRITRRASRRAWGEAPVRFWWKCAIVVARRKNVLRLPNDGVEGGGTTAKAQVVSQTRKDGKLVDSYTARSVTTSCWKLPASSVKSL